uniref:Poly [ADP-ribose] polymerase n=1 Tax=Phallusia mammillata TaxID=59560 RepID=A0A6F9DNV9_9ASCI|nr:poly [ADP-ribose] polymerase 2-like [Phallusia mammillata]
MSQRPTRRSTRNKPVKQEPEAPLQERQNQTNNNDHKLKRKKRQSAQPVEVKKQKKTNNVEVKIKQEVELDKTSEEVVNKTITFKGVVPVDEECIRCQKNYHVYVNGESVYNAMLNQTNVGRNNNKYYLIQLLKHDSKPQYFTWFRWGRVGKIAGTNLQELPLNRAIEVFEKKFLDKTKNLWEMRNCFEKFDGKYDLLEMDYGDNQLPEKVEPKLQPKIESKLSKELQDLISMIFDQTEFEASVKEMQYNIKRAPLGKLNDKQIKAGYSTLKRLEKCLQKKNHKGIVEACNEFYTRIPHDFGMKRPPVIHSVAEMKPKLELLQALSDIKVAITIIDETNSKCPKENPLDSHYRSLQCELSALPSDSPEFKLIQLYASNTHASTHRNYNLKVENVFSVCKSEADKTFRTDLGNCMLLWHGSRLTNWCSILQQGLRIAPPEAPSTGYMFGKGVYFADMVSKSANYCFASTRQSTGFVLLCDVALGNTCDKLAADYEADKMPSGFHATKGLGKTQPNPKENLITDNGKVVVPCGKPVTVNEAKSSALLYNEYVVYNVNQIRPRYLVQLRFDFMQGW